MKQVADFYLSHPKLIGAVYCAVPSLIWFILVLVSVPFREVYLLRLALCLLVGCPIGAYLNKYFLLTSADPSKTPSPHRGAP